MCTAVGVGNGIGIVDKEERLCRLGSNLYSGTIYRRIGGTIGPVAGMNRLQRGRPGGSIGRFARLRNA